MSLKAEIDRFGQLFNRRLNDNSKATLRWVTAQEIDWQNKTMTALGIDDLPYHDVVLGVGSTTVKPVQGTDCLIAIVENDDATSFLLYADETELIEFNSGKNGGLLILEPFLKELNDLVENYNGHTHPGVIVSVTGGSGAPAVGTPGNTKAISKEVKKFDIKNFENTLIKH